MSKTPIVVTGLGATTPLGGDVASTWEGLLAGRSGVSKIEQAWADDLAVRIAASAAVDPSEVLERVEARRLDRSAQLGVIAAMEAWRDAGFGLKEDNPVDRERLGVAIATGIGGLHTLLGNWDVQKEKGARRVSPSGHPHADGQRHRRQRQPPARGPGRRAHPGLGLRLQQRVDRPRHRHDPSRTGRRRRGGRHGRRHPPPADRLLRPDAGDEPPQRRARARVAPLGRRPGRLRPR